MADADHRHANPSMADVVSDLVTELLDECVLDAIIDAHREARLSNAKCGICRTRCRAYSTTVGLDIFGRRPTPDTQEMMECTNCNRSFAASRYAPHLEKCLGIAGRGVGRTTGRR